MAEEIDELVAVEVALIAKRDAILKKSAPLHKARGRLVPKIQDLERELASIDAEIKAIEQPKLRDVGNALANIARARGAITMKAE